MFILKILKVIFLLPLFIITVFGQDTDTTDADATGRESYTSVDISYSQDKGNTDFLSLYYGFSYSLLGDVGPLKDTEFLFDFNRSDDQLDGEPFTDDQALTLKFDVWANQRFSPFLFFQKSFDKVIGLEDRLNYGLGAKVALPFGMSVSYAFLFEKEDYLFYSYTDSAAYDLNGNVSTGDYYYTDSIALDPGDYDYWDYYYYGDTVHFEDDDSVFYSYTDSVAYYYYTDSTESAPDEFFRHSIRPKIKLKLFDGNMVFDYRFYYKPKVSDLKDYLLEHELKISIATFYEALTIDLNYTNKYNKRYDGVTIINPQTYAPYKDTDENITLGISLAL